MERISPPDRISTREERRGGVEGRHFASECLSQILRGGFESVDGGSELRRAALYHFSACCPDCLDGLERLSGESLVGESLAGESLTGESLVGESLVGESLAATWDRKIRDPVVLALRHRLELPRSRPDLNDPIVWLRAPHRYWLELIDREALSFARVVLEESRRYALEVDSYPEAAESHTRKTREDLADDRLRQLGVERWHDLCGLASAYLADDCRMQGRLRASKEYLLEGEKQLFDGTGDIEAHATLLELEADFLICKGLGQEALGRLNSAAQLLAGSPIRGRLAETRVREGTVLLRLGKFAAATQTLEGALAEMDHNVDFQTRLRALHYLAFALIQHREFGRALDYLAKGEPFYGDRASERFRLERLVMYGTSLLETRHFEKAEWPLKEAVERLYRRGLWTDAAKALADLGRLYMLSGRAEEAARTGKRYSDLLGSKAAHDLSHRELEKLRSIAKKAGIPLDDVKPREELSP